MEQVLVERTRNYLVLKIPLMAVRKRRVFIGDSERAAVSEGLMAVRRGEISNQFDSAKEAVAFLRKL